MQARRTTACRVDHKHRAVARPELEVSRILAAIEQGDAAAAAMRDHRHHHHNAYQRMDKLAHAKQGR